MVKNQGRLNNLQAYLVTAYTWSIAVISTIFFTAIGSLTLWALSRILGRGIDRWVHLVGIYWSRCLLWLCPVWSLEADGLENFERNRAYVIVANHQSLLDIVVIYAALTIHFKFMAKKELFRIPFLGWHMFLAGDIPIDRGNRDSAKRAIEKSRDWLRKGFSVVFFPEGTRSTDGEIQPFKAGAFKIAAEEKIEILPVVIDGTGDTIPKHDWKIHRTACFRLSVGKPVSVATNDPALVENARDLVREEMKKRLSRLRLQSLSCGAENAENLRGDCLASGGRFLR